MALTFPANLSVHTLDQYIAHKTEPINRMSPFWAKAKERGRIKTNDTGGKTIRWLVTYRRQEPVALTGPVMATSFPNWNFDVECSLGWAGWHMGASVDYLTKVLNSHSEVQWFNAVAGRVDKMTGDFLEYLKSVPYLDGNAAGAAGFMGIESFMGNTDAVVTNSLALAPSDTYAGRSTVLGTMVDDWTTAAGEAWPDGQGDVGHCYFSPVITKATAAHGAATATWAGGNAPYALTYVDSALGRLQSMSPDTYVMTNKMFREFCNLQISKEQLEITDPNSYLIKLGHKVKTYMGSEIVQDYNCPLNCCYGITWDKLTVKTPQPQLLSYEKSHEIESSDDLHKQLTVLQCVWESPAYFVKILAA